MNDKFREYLAKYHSVDADNATENLLMAAQHSLAKWRSFRKSVLDLYDLEIRYGDICAKEDLDEDSDNHLWAGANCALCHINEDFCMTCPIAIKEIRCSEDDSTFTKFVNSGNPAPMIRLLTKIVQELLENKGEKS